MPRQPRKISPTKYYHVMIRDNNREYFGYKPKVISQNQIDFVMAFFSNKIDLLKSFHQEEDHDEYLETRSLSENTKLNFSNTI